MKKTWAGLLLLLAGFVVGMLMTGCAPTAPNEETKAVESTAENPADGTVNAEVIYGQDNRHDLYETNDSGLLGLASSTVALIANKNIKQNGSGYTVSSSTFGQSYSLCSSEKFREQENAAFCSGTLVGPDLILTAGHCVRDAAACADVNFVFGYAVLQLGILPRNFSAQDVYRCRGIVSRTEQSAGPDYAVIKLDRAVSGRRPLPIRRSGEVSNGDRILVIGHPAGLPTKITDGAIVRDNSKNGYFVTNLDTYGGNSGSAVFSASSGLIEGILVRGDTDFETRGGCTVSVVRPENSGRGEDVTKISVARSAIPDLGGGGGGGGGPVTPPPVDPPPPTGGPIQFTASPKLSIPDNNKTGISTGLNVPVAIGGRKVSVAIQLSHTYIGDLAVRVVSPEGITVILHNRAGRNARNIVGVYGKTLTSSQSLAPLSSAKAGTWRLDLLDLAAQDVGVIEAWGLIIE